MQTYLRYKIEFASEIPSLLLIQEKLSRYLKVDFFCEEGFLREIDYPDGVKTYQISADTFNEMLELAIVEGSPSVLHIHATKGKHSLPELVLSILLEEGGEITYNSLQEKSWLSSLFSK